MSVPSPVPPRLSAAVLLLRQGSAGLEVYMVRRPIQSDFAPDVYVFPGGSVHQSDCDAEVTPGVVVPLAPLDPDTTLGTGVRIAAIRELFEEAGIFLAYRERTLLDLDDPRRARLSTYRADLLDRKLTMAEVATKEDCVFATDMLTHYAHWMTPEAYPKRFNTHFFLAELPPGQEPVPDPHETMGGVWIQPEVALTQYARGEFPLVFATVYHLRGLTPFTTPLEAILGWRYHTPPMVMPRITYRQGREIILMPDEAEPT